MKIIYLLSKSLFPFVLGGMLGASIWGETQLLWWMVALIIIGIPYLAGQLYVYHRYRKFVNEIVGRKFTENDKMKMMKRIGNSGLNVEQRKTLISLIKTKFGTQISCL